MAHRLEKNDWMFSALRPAWHGIGTVTEGAENARDAIRIAKLDWGTGKRPIYRFEPEDPPVAAQVHLDALRQLGVPVNVGQLRDMKAWCVTIREDLPFENPASDLGCVRESYTVIDNVASFGLIDRIIGGVGAKYETAGSLMNGKMVFLLARYPKDITVKDDTIRPFLLLSTAHDGSKALEVKFTTVRVVCWNTMSVALSDASTATVRIKHTAGAVDANGNVRQHLVDSTRQSIHDKAVEKGAATGNAELISSAALYINQQQKLYLELADYPTHDDFVRDYLNVLVPEPLKGSGTRSNNKRSAIKSLYYGRMPGDDQEAMRLTPADSGVKISTAYRLFNAVTHFNDHVASNHCTVDKGTGERKSFAEARFSRIMKADGFREDALNILTEAVDSNGESLRAALSGAQEKREEILMRQLATN